MLTRNLFEKVEAALEKRFPAICRKVRVRIFDAGGCVIRESGDPTANPDSGSSDIVINIRSISPTRDAEIRAANRGR